MTTEPSDLIQTIVRAENQFPRTFANAIERDWGVLFVTPTIPDSYDGNHAGVLSHDIEVSSVVAEIADFYESRGLSPRVNYVSAEGDHSGLREALRAAGFTFSSENPRLYLFRNPSRILPNPLVRVRLVPAVDSDLLTSLASINNMRMAKVLQRRAVRPDGWLFVAEIDGEPAAVALLERLGDIARVDEVHTAERYRGKGCARTVIHTLVAYYQAHLNIPLFLWTYNPIAERIYIEAGFYKLDNPPAIWYTWRERK